MCFDVNNQTGMRQYIEHLLSMSSGTGDSCYRAAEAQLKATQKARGYLTNYEIVGRRLQKKVMITGKPGVKAVESAITEGLKTEVPKTKTARATARV